MQNALSNSRKRSRSPSPDGHGTISSPRPPAKRLNIGTGAAAAPGDASARLNPIGASLPPTPTTVAPSDTDTDATTFESAAVGLRSKAGNTMVASMIHMRCLILTQDASVIIGKGGKRIAQTRNFSSARILISEAVFGSTERILNVSGQIENVAKAFGLIAKRLTDEPSDQLSSSTSRPITLRLVIPHQRMGCIIGKGGAAVKEIQEASGAVLKAGDQTLPGSTERILSIVGVADSIHIATYHIAKALLQAQTFHGSVNTAVYCPYTVSSVQYPTQPASINSMINLAGLSHVPTAFAFGAGQQQLLLLQQQFHPPLHQSFSTMLSPNIGRLQKEVTVPGELMGNMIGKGGVKIREVRMASQAIINIPDPEPGAPTTAARKIVVSGPPHNVQMAVQMLCQRIAYETAKKIRSSAA
ncbi:hypothetical protein BKA62DRAFT_680557 [Auriculariales sp. MPI-PUGE-AT-0066]|nr:hypothetical protein BKA62DRAFT_680557 [Auriculariales sp. MPI-PUGE-AT-0066]